MTMIITVQIPFPAWNTEFRDADSTNVLSVQTPWDEMQPQKLELEVTQRSGRGIVPVPSIGIESRQEWTLTVVAVMLTAANVHTKYGISWICSPTPSRAGDSLYCQLNFSPASVSKEGQQRCTGPS